MITVTQSLESLQRVIVDQRMVIEKLRDAGRPQGEPFDELKREMKAMEEAHEARLKQVLIPAPKHADRVRMSPFCIKLIFVDLS